MLFEMFVSRLLKVPVTNCAPLDLVLYGHPYFALLALKARADLLVCQKNKHRKLVIQLVVTLVVCTSASVLGQMTLGSLQEDGSTEGWVLKNANQLCGVDAIRPVDGLMFGFVGGAARGAGRGGGGGGAALALVILL